MSPATGCSVVAGRTSGASRLPALGRRGGGWVALQLGLVALMAIATLLGPRWPAASRDWLLAAAAATAIGGAMLFAGAAAGLGRQITPFPKPIDGGSLRSTGAYRLVRHPMYGGVLLLLLAWALAACPLALAPWALALAFLDAKRRREEAWLIEQHADYLAYRRRVRAALLPLVW